MQVPGSTAAGAYGELTGQLSLRTGGECGSLLMPALDPVQGSCCPQRISDSIERISGNPIDTLHSADVQGVDDSAGNCGHGGPPNNDRSRVPAGPASCALSLRSAARQ